MLSRRLWRVLQTTPQHPFLHRVVAVNTPSLFPAFIIELTHFFGCFLLVTLPFIVVPVMINVSCLSASLHIAGTIAYQHELQTYTLLAMTPLGEYGFAFELSRFRTQNIRNNLKDVSNFGKIIGTILVVLVVMSIGFVWLSPRASFNDLVFLFPVMGFFVILGALYFEYRQSLVLAVVVGLLAGSTGERLTARTGTIAGYVTIQLTLLLLTWFPLNLFGALLNQPTLLHPSAQLALTIVLTLPCYFAAREVVIYVLWRWLLQRMNDDLPALMRVAPR